MELYLVRHAEAVPAVDGMPDASRPLSTPGRRDFAQVVKRLRRAGVRWDRLVHSPLLRAVETAEIAMPLLAAGGESVVSPFLAEPPAEPLLAEAQGERCAFVGHQPWLGELCAWLVTGSREHGPRFPFVKGGVARLVGRPEPGGMTLGDLWTPESLRRLSR